MPIPSTSTSKSSSTSSSSSSILALLLTFVLAGGCGKDNSPNSIDSHAAPAGLAILVSDYKKTSVTLLDPSSIGSPGSPALTDCLHSDDPTVLQPLSGDVSLPSQAQQEGELVLIDRGSSVLTFVDPSTCVPRGQLSVSTGGLQANPRDVIRVSAHKAYVSRYTTNPMPTDDPLDFDEGDDLLVVDPLALGPGQTPILKRIALSGYATSVPGTTIQARPDRGVLVDGKVYLTLGNLDEKYSAAGAGRIVVIDPASDAVVDVIELPEQKGCSAIDYVAATNRLYVSCQGGPFNDPDAVATSALVEIDLSGERPSLGRSVLASTLGATPINLSSVAVLGETAFVGTWGALDPSTNAMTTPDRFYAVALGTGAAALLLEGGAFNFGRANVDSVRKKVFLPDGDAAKPRVHVFDGSGDPIVAAESFDADPAAHLPPREIAWY